MPIKVEQGHSLAQFDAAHGRGHTRWPWRSMAIWDSFMTDKGSVVAAACYFSRRNPDYKFSVRKVDKDHWRVWRVEVND